MATLGSFEAENARSIALATVASESPGRSGVAMPMGPVSLRTGTVGRVENGHMVVALAGRDSVRKRVARI